MKAQLSQWFLGRKRSEQLMIVGAILAGLYLALTQLLIAPLTQARKSLNAEIAAQQQATKEIEMSINQLNSAEQRALVAQNRNRVAALAQQLSEVKAEIERLDNSLVGSGQMAKVLGQMLQLHAGITLQSLENFPAQPLQASPTEVESVSEDETENETGNDAENETPAPAIKAFSHPLYKHTMRLTLRGKYLDIIAYLQTVETLPWTVFWDEVTLDVDEYPYSVVTLEFYTVSSDQAWFAIS